MSRVLVFTVDIDRPGAPVNGGVLRVQQLKRHLESLGHEVLVSMPASDESDLAGSGHDVDLAHASENLKDVVEHVKPDVAVCEQWHLASKLTAIEVPLWLDLHGSLLGENAFRRRGGSEESARYGAEALSKLRAFERADVVSCAGARQRLYFRGWLAACGGSYADWDVLHLPLSLPVKIADRRRKPRKGLRILYAGNLWPWIDLGSWLPAFLEAVAGLPEARVDFFVDDPIGRKDALEILNEASGGTEFEALSKVGRISVSGRLSHTEFLEVAEEYDVAIDLFSWNQERELAVTTRSLEYLSLGVPVLYPSHAELAELISTITPDLVLDSFDCQSITSALAELADPGWSRHEFQKKVTAKLDLLEGTGATVCGEVMRRLAGCRRRQRNEAADRFAEFASRVVREQMRKERSAAEAARLELDEAYGELELIREEVSEKSRMLADVLGDREAVTAELRRVNDRFEQLLGTSSDIADAFDRLRDDIASEIRGHRESTLAQLSEIRVANGEMLGSLRDALERVTTDQERARNELQVFQASTSARQTACLVADSKPAIRRRSIGRRARLAALFIDHLLVRLYMEVWQRLRRQRIFPGM